MRLIAFPPPPPTPTTCRRHKGGKGEGKGNDNGNDNDNTLGFNCDTSIIPDNRKDKTRTKHELNPRSVHSVHAVPRGPTAASRATLADRSEPWANHVHYYSGGALPRSSMAHLPTPPLPRGNSICWGTVIKSYATNSGRFLMKIYVEFLSFRAYYGHIARGGTSPTPVPAGHS